MIPTWSEISTIVELKLRGYLEDYIVRDKCLIRLRTGERCAVTDFDVDEIHYFRRGFFWSERLDIFAVKCKANGMKGIAMSCYSKLLNPFNFF
jgi:hypothetical protein